MRARSTSKVTIRAVVTRGDGTVEDHGIVARWHRSRLVRLKWWLSDAATRKRRKIKWL